jgi:hypothetical protein
VILDKFGGNVLMHVTGTIFRLQAGWSWNWDLIPSRGKRLLSSSEHSDWFWG